MLATHAKKGTSVGLMKQDTLVGVAGNGDVFFQRFTNLMMSTFHPGNVTTDTKTGVRVEGLLWLLKGGKLHLS